MVFKAVLVVVPFRKSAKWEGLGMNVMTFCEVKVEENRLFRLADDGEHPAPGMEDWVFEKAENGKMRATIVACVEGASAGSDIYIGQPRFFLADCRVVPVD